MITSYRKFQAERNQLKQALNKLFENKGGEVVETETRVKTRYDVFKQRYASGKSIV